jgi:hypothetical protein
MKVKSINLVCVFFILVATCLTSCSVQKKENVLKKSNVKIDSSTIKFTYQKITGIGKDSLYNRRDNSDIIKVGDTYYIWYSRMNSPITSGYWATIWYATSKDEGYSWHEQGMALGLGKKADFDSHSVFTPNILAYGGKYYLYYTGVKPTLGNLQGEFEANHTTDFTAFGLAVADNPDGPFKRVENNPVLEISKNPQDFDSYRIDDASLLVKDNKIWLYYKGRSLVHGVKGPKLTEMSVAYANHPKGPFAKHKGSLLNKSHEVLIWKKDAGVASLASISKSINYAKNGNDFTVLADSLAHIPKAPGLYRPDLENGNKGDDTPGWGVAMKVKKGEAYLIRYEMK